MRSDEKYNNPPGKTKCCLETEVYVFNESILHPYPAGVLTKNINSNGMILRCVFDCSTMQAERILAKVYAKTEIELLLLLQQSKV